MTKEYKYNFIYKITREDGKFYVGMHSTNNLNDGYMGSGKYIKSSIKKYGRDKHKLEILEFVETREILKIKERDMVTEEMLLDGKCMNLTTGGNGGRRRNLVNVLKIGNTNRTMVSKEEFYTNRDLYIATNDNKVAVIDNITGLGCVIDKQLYYESDRYSHFCSGKIAAVVDGIVKFVSKEDFINKGYVGVNSGKVDGKCNPNAKHIKIFDNDNNLRFDCIGDFKTTCINENLPHIPLMKSHKNNGSKLGDSMRKMNQLIKMKLENYAGWYAVMIDSDVP